MKTVEYVRLFRQRIVLLLITSLLATACENDQNESPLPEPDTVLAWNQGALVAVARMTNPATGEFVLPHPESRMYAIVHLAMYDALNNIQRKNAPYALQEAPVATADPDAAVGTAAHDALVAVLPEQKTYADSLYQALLAKVSDGEAKTQGIALGQAAAKAILAKRTGDGSDNTQIPFVTGTNPGDYQFTPPFDQPGPPFNGGFYALAGWKNVQPFALTSASQFRLEAPPALTSSTYTANFNEIKALGGAVSATRTPDQTAQALYWLDNSPRQWNRIARAVLAAKKRNAYATAQLLAHLHMAEADAYLAMADTKLAYPRWRPITAIHLAATDNNPDTAPDAAWMPLAFPNPPDAEYPSGHAVAGGAAAAVLRSFFATDDMPFAVTNNAGVTRSYTSFSQAAAENSDSRIYAGYHFRNSTEGGQDLGEKIGAYVSFNTLK